jgi:hypothetical protein
VRIAAATVVLATALATLPAAGVAQRAPDRFAASVSWREPGAGAAALLPPRLPDPAAPAPSRRDSGLTAGLFISEAVTGSVGAALGFYFGAAAGGRSCDVVGSCGGEDPGLGRAVIGALAGFWLGTAVGSHVGGGLAGGPTGSWGARLGAAAGGVLAAIGVAALVHPDLDRPATYVALPVVAAAVTALLVPRR